MEGSYDKGAAVMAPRRLFGSAQLKGTAVTDGERQRSPSAQQKTMVFSFELLRHHVSGGVWYIERKVPKSCSEIFDAGKKNAFPLRES